MACADCKKRASTIMAELEDFVKKYESNNELKYVILHKLKAMQERKSKCKMK